MLTKLKQKIQQTLTGVAKIAHRLRFTPNRISIVGFTLALATAITYALTTTEQPWLLILAVVFLLTSGFCDTLDGIVARTFEQTTVFGGFFDSVLDRYADAVVYTGIIIAGLCNPIWGLAALTGSVLVSYSRARAEAAGVKMESVGFAERAERMLILAVASMVAFWWLEALNYGIIVLAVVSNLTVIQRALHVYRELKKEKQ
ncbi:MAG: archaetidylinositol phosphate synthase [Candidatus Bathyarchaeota archaeon]|nr:archaetidylinositol phosphate synthase [Candidatus Bathyarchaeota archaeon]